MQRRYLNEADQNLVNRWRLILVGLYSSLALVTILLASLNPAKEGATVTVRTSPPDLIQANLKR
jgi:hypothetical protein